MFSRSQVIIVQNRRFHESSHGLNSDAGTVFDLSHDVCLHLVVAGAVTLLERHAVDLIDVTDVPA